METLQRMANRGSISTGYDIDNSVKLEPDNSESIQRSHSDIGTPTDQKLVTISFWIKRTELLASGDHKIFEGVAGANKTWISWNNDRIKFKSDFSNPQNLITTRQFHDASAWYHICIAMDTSQGTAANRVKIYINGVQETAFDTETYPNQNNNSYFFESSMSHYIGGASGGGAGYWADFYLIDGQQKAATDFGEFDEDSGIWKPKAYSGTFGDEGYHIDFEDSSALGADVSGNSNNFGTLTNVAAADQATDTPTNNFATWNALFNATGASSGYLGGLLISEGGTEAAGISGWDTALSTIAVSSGKWYAEFYITGSGTPVYTMIGAAQAERFDLVIKTGGYYVGHSGSSGYSVSLYGVNGGTYPAQDQGGDASKFNAGAIISVALDMDNQKIYWREDGTWLLSDDPASDNGYAIPWTGDTYFGVSQYDADNSIQANFGGYHANTVSSGNADANGYGNFEYAVPSGYYALCTKNLAEFGG